MWITPRPLNATICTRPIRIAYLIPEAPSHELLDVLFSESLSRWGGRRTVLIPTSPQSIEPAYWALLNLWDADQIYSYVQLSESLESSIYSMFAPAELKYHGFVESDHPNDLRPELGHNFNFLSSLSLIPFIARRAEIRGNSVPEIVDKEPGYVTERDLADSFGFVSSGNCDCRLLPYARRLVVGKRPGQKIAQRFREHEASYIEPSALLETMGKHWNPFALTDLSDMFCPHLHHLAHGREGWNDHFSIVVGDEVADRLLFWNAQHRYRSGDGLSDMPLLRLSPKHFENGAPSWLKDWVAIRNHRHMDGNQAPQVVLRSCSIPKAQLAELAGLLGAQRMVLISTEQHTDPCLFGDCEKWVSGSRKGIYSSFPSIWSHPAENRRATIRLQNNALEVPLTPPWHIKDLPAPALSSGAWAVDLTIDRAEDHSPFVNKRHTWKWPRRLRLDQSVMSENYGAGRHFPALPLPIRPTEAGDLTALDCASWSRPTFFLPNDYGAFATALKCLSPGSPEEKKALESGAAPERFHRIAVSDKGRDLLGVLQFFGSFPEALSFLTNPFWLYVIRHLSPQEPSENEKNISDIAGRLQEILQDDTGGASNLKRLAKRALSLAARSFESQGEQLKAKPFEGLLTWAATVTGRKQAEVRECLEESVTYLRDRDFLWQGYGWTCSFCQHRNWIALRLLSPIAECEICRNKHSAPVAGSLHFRLNPFVYHAFSSTSAQEPVIWCLDILARRAMFSFAFAPSLELYRRERTGPETDLDIVAAVDGEIYFVEVKSSFAGVTSKDLEQLKLLAEDHRPDVIMLAVKAIKADAGKFVDIIEAFSCGMETKGVRFELLTLSEATPAAQRQIPLPNDKRMIWTMG